MTRADQPVTPTHAEPEEFQPLAALLAFLLPGLGHWYLGERRRAAYIAAGVLGLFFGGLLIGGISCVDSGLVYHNYLKKLTGGNPNLEKTREGEGEPIWFLGQALVGPVAIATDYLHQYQFKVRVPLGMGIQYRTADPDEGRDPASGAPISGGNPPYTKALGRPAELGTLYSTLAGMLNLMCIIDAGFHRRRRTAPGGVR